VNTSDQTAPLQQEEQAPQWNLTIRIGFRFCFVYFGLYCLTTQILGSLFTNPEVDVPDPSTCGRCGKSFSGPPAIFFA
jgi:hypothetical protein